MENNLLLRVNPHDPTDRSIQNVGKNCWYVDPSLLHDVTGRVVGGNILPTNYHSIPRQYPLGSCSRSVLTTQVHRSWY